MSPPGPVAYRIVALVGKYQSPDAAAALAQLADLLRLRGCEVLIEQATARATGLDGLDGAAFAEIGRRAALAIVVGGDGTLLHAARQLAGYDVPLVGINQGRLGFMTDIAREDMLARVEELLAGRFTPERRLLLEVKVLRAGQSAAEALALNDVVVSKGELGRMIELEVSIDGEFVYNLRADGMIVATPTGSTAYALSANGPILHPQVPGIALVPLCPHALSNRPITLGDGAVIEIKLLAPHDARAHFDGQDRCDLAGGDIVRVARARATVCLLHPPGYSYFAMLREKLRWSEAPRGH